MHHVEHLYSGASVKREGYNKYMPSCSGATVKKERYIKHQLIQALVELLGEHESPLFYLLDALFLSSQVQR